jgi:hypothetical protein
MPTMRRPILLAAALLMGVFVAPSPVLAGGIGAYNGTGFHFGRALTTTGGQGAWLNEGGGVELLLGRQTSRIHGRLRFAYNAIIDLTEGSEVPVRHSAVIGLGAKIELLEDIETPGGLYIAADIGVSPLVTHLRSYFFVDLGAGVRFNPAERVSLFAEVTFLLRFQKVVAAGPMFFFGARVAFD